MIDKNEIKDLLYAQLLDGQRGGQFTMRADALVAEVADILAEYLEDR